MSLIELHNITKIYRVGSQKVVALKNLSLVFERGDFAVLAGPSGSGKTTALNMIGGLDRPTSGQVLVNDLDLGKANLKRLADFRLHNIGFIFQSYNLIPVLTAAENAEFTLMLQKTPRHQRRERVLSLFADLGISGLEDRLPKDLSGGQQQRVAIARAIAANPRVILADEPTANLDSNTAEDLLSLMRQLNNSHGTTFVFSSHDDKVIRRAKRIIRLEDGLMVSDNSQNL
ncbi:MAG: ABC transporter ATP-binding protein [Deltaproteobacteria bacterium]|jgi:putative ABC transport system ATP-binding protein|nr:ABC transporter ATP-binding protein [Deltaproteobacteria bacterium]MBW2504640.1 ABC transporter ATP-binding protein [Deltaproteobacteria bacterium]MBW2520630.1 ABC transporter ATP-binding protein [Deltaproteobacteria bacterium]